jgi:probable F420-dependent oxidoreductase
MTSDPAAPTLPSRGITVLQGSVRDVGAAAAQAEAAGFDTVWSPEFYTRSAIVTLAHIAGTTSTARMGSSIAYAVGRSPLTIATEARSLDELCGGRLVLGLGTGTKRMMYDWHGTSAESPALRMEELVPLLRRLWRLHDGPVSHTGHFYRVELKPTAEVSAPVRAEIPVYTAAVNDRMIETAGRVADGLMGHCLFSPGYVTEFVRPALARGAQRTGRDPAAIEVTSLVITSVCDDEEQARREVAAQIAFYIVPSAYATVLERHGFGAATARVREAFAAGDFDAMVKRVPDEMIDTFAVAGTPAQVRAGLRRFDEVLDHVIVYPPSFRLSPERASEVLHAAVRHCAPRHGGSGAAEPGRK